MLSAAAASGAPSAATSYADDVAQVLRVFADIAGFLEVEGRSHSGLGTLNLRYAPRDLAAGLPEAALRALGDEYSLSVRLVLRADSGPAPLAVPAVVARWRLATAFDVKAEPGHRHVIADGEHERLAGILRALPEPSALIEAGPEVVAAWRLRTPETNIPRIAGALGAVAAALGAEAFVDLTSAAIPIGGWTRSWNPPPASAVCIVTARPDLAYELPELVATLTNHKETEDARANQERRVGGGRGARGRG